MVGKSLGAAESVARAFGLKSHAERRAAATAAPGAAIGAAAPAAAELAFPSADDVAAADARLAACIAEAEARPGPPSRMQVSGGLGFRDAWLSACVAEAEARFGPQTAQTLLHAV